jgi:hypothetical protein
MFRLKLESGAKPPEAAEPPAAALETWLSYCQWKAGMLNELFRRHGQTGQPGNISAATIAASLERGLPLTTPVPRAKGDKL